VKVEGGVFAVGTVIFAVLAAVYWFLAQEPVGTTGLVLTSGLCFLVAFYVLFTGRRVGERPEDQLTAEVADGAGEYGHFTPTSVWPLPLGVSAATVTLGLVVGWWLFILGLIGLMYSIIGLVFEHYRSASVDV
jgi:Cytochrome c oxidase subunit IV